MKDRAYDEVSQKIDAVRDELSDQIVALGKLIEDRVGSQPLGRPD